MDRSLSRGPAQVPPPVPALTAGTQPITSLPVRTVETVLGALDTLTVVQRLCTRVKYTLNCASLHICLWSFRERWSAGLLMCSRERGPLLPPSPACSGGCKQPVGSKAPVRTWPSPWPQGSVIDSRIQVVPLDDDISFTPKSAPHPVMTSWCAWLGSTGDRWVTQGWLPGDMGSITTWHPSR